MKSLKNLRTMILLSFFIALSIVGSKFFSIETVSRKIGFGFIITALMCSIFNPSLAVFAAILIDFISNSIFPTPGGFYLPFVLTKIVSALIYTFFFYRKEIKTTNIIMATSLNSLITSLFMNTLWTSNLTGNPFMTQFVLRIPTMAINYVVHTIVLILILPKLSKLLRNEVKRISAEPINAPY